MYFTRMSTFAEDLARGLAFVRESAGEEVVVVGHSAGGGLAQFCLDKGRVGGVGVGKVKGVVLAGSVPGFGRYVLILISFSYRLLILMFFSTWKISRQFELIS